jgi:hypothetical protein
MSEGNRDETPGRRANDRLASEVDEFVTTTQIRLHHIFLSGLVTMAIIGIVTAGSLFAFGAVVRTNDHKADQATALAKRAYAQSQKSAFRQELQREKVCSQSSIRRIACQALFERLAKSLSLEQRDRLACSVLTHLKGPTAEKLREENPQCHKP